MACWFGYLDCCVELLDHPASRTTAQFSHRLVGMDEHGFVHYQLSTPPAYVWWFLLKLFISFLGWAEINHPGVLEMQQEELQASTPEKVKVSLTLHFEDGGVRRSIYNQSPEKQFHSGTAAGWTLDSNNMGFQSLSPLAPNISLRFKRISEMITLTRLYILSLEGLLFYWGTFVGDFITGGVDGAAMDDVEQSLAPEIRDGHKGKQLQLLAFDSWVQQQVVGKTSRSGNK